MKFCTTKHMNVRSNLTKPPEMANQTYHNNRYDNTVQKGNWTTIHPNKVRWVFFLLVGLESSASKTKGELQKLYLFWKENILKMFHRIWILLAHHRACWVWMLEGNDHRGFKWHQINLIANLGRKIINLDCFFWTHFLNWWIFRWVCQHSEFTLSLYRLRPKMCFFAWWVCFISTSKPQFHFHEINNIENEITPPSSGHWIPFTKSHLFLTHKRCAKRVC